MFKNRKDAGEKLARALERYRVENPLILAIPRGGVEVGLQVARKMNADFSLIIARKLPFPDNPEAGFGAIAENGSTFIFENAHYWLAGETIEQIKQQQIAEIDRRVKALRGGNPLPVIAKSNRDSYRRRHCNGFYNAGSHRTLQKQASRKNCGCCTCGWKRDCRTDSKTGR